MGAVRMRVQTADKKYHNNPHHSSPSVNILWGDKLCLHETNPYICNICKSSIYTYTHTHTRVYIYILSLSIILLNIILYSSQVKFNFQCTCSHFSFIILVFQIANFAAPKIYFNSQMSSYKTLLIKVYWETREDQTRLDLKRCESFDTEMRNRSVRCCSWRFGRDKQQRWSYWNMRSLDTRTHKYS